MEDFLLILVITLFVVSIIYIRKSKGLKNKHGGDVLPVDLLKRDINDFRNTNDTFINAENLLKTNITKAKKSIQKRTSKAHLTGCVWLLIDEDKELLYTFQDNDEIIFTDKVSVTKGTYEIIVDNNTILITRNGITENFELIVESQHFLFLKKFFSDDIMIFANYTKYKDFLKEEVKKQAKEEYRKLMND
ncbi:MAG: hypothetical protein LC112_02710 [Flavobacteriales bacterium]|nr:hypothetical protein [Flavobacteriales bacterium]